MATTEPIRSKKYVKQLAAYYQHAGNYRNYLLVVMGLHTALRISDLLRLQWDNVYDFKKHEIRRDICLTEQKTGKSKKIALNKHIVRALKQYAPEAAKSGHYLIENKNTGKAISRVQAYRIIRAAADALELGRVSCHSLRKTFGYHAWKTGVSPVIIMDIYNHNSLAVTRRYLGVTQDEKNEVYLGLNYSA